MQTDREHICGIGDCVAGRGAQRSAVCNYATWFSCRSFVWLPQFQPKKYERNRGRGGRGFRRAGRPP
jgi:hypothetical protein